MVEEEGAEGASLAEGGDEGEAEGEAARAGETSLDLRRTSRRRYHGSERKQTRVLERTITAGISEQRRWPEEDCLARRELTAILWLILYALRIAVRHFPFSIAVAAVSTVLALLSNLTFVPGTTDISSLRASVADGYAMASTISLA